MKSLTTVLLVLFGFCLSLTSSGFAQTTHTVHLTDEEIGYIETHPRIRVHNEKDWPPFNFFSKGQPRGVSIDVMNRVAGLPGLKIDYVTGPSWSEFIEMLPNNELDVILNIVQTPERQKEFLFTTPYCQSLGGVYIRKKDAEKYRSLTDLDGKTLALCAGCATEKILKAAYPRIRLLPTGGPLECLEAVSLGKADAFTQEIGATDYMLSQKMATNVILAFPIADDVFQSDLRMAVSRKDRTLFSILQKGLEAIPESEMHAIRRKWLVETREKRSKSIVTLNSKEREYLLENKTLRVCVIPSMDPLEHSGHQWNYGGLSSDFMEEVARRVGLRVQQVPVGNPEEALQSIRDGECQIVPFLGETNGADDLINFTSPYLEIPIVIVTRIDAGFINEYHGLKGKKVLSTADSFLVRHFREKHPEIHLTVASNQLEAFHMVSQDKAFAALASLPVAVNIIAETEMRKLKISGLLPKKNRARLGVVKDEEVLFGILEKSINSITEQEKDDILRRRFDVQIERKPNRTLLIIVAIVAALTALFLLWRQHILRRYNTELKELNEKLDKLSTTDHLTFLYNRFFTDRVLSQEIERINRYPGFLSAVLLDIDCFKRVNDQFGHMKGDEVLKQIAGILKSNVRSVDVVGRWGGEEFILLLPETPLANAGDFAEKIRTIIATADFGIGREVTASFGVCQYSAPESMDQFLARIDAGLYQAKKTGRNRVVVC